MEINLSDLFADCEICDCYMMHGGYCYPITEISGVKFSKYPLINIASSKISDLAFIITCDDQVSYLLHIRTTVKGIPGLSMYRPNRMSYSASKNNSAVVL